MMHQQQREFAAAVLTLVPSIETVPMTNKPTSMILLTITIPFLIGHYRFIVLKGFANL